MGFIRGLNLPRNPPGNRKVDFPSGKDIKEITGMDYFRNVVPSKKEWGRFKDMMSGGDWVQGANYMVENMRSKRFAQMGYKPGNYEQYPDQTLPPGLKPINPLFPRWKTVGLL